MDAISTPACLYRPRQFVVRHASEGWTEGSIRWLIFCAAANGLDDAGAIVRQGRRVFIDEERFFSWLRSVRVPTDHRGRIAQEPARAA